MELFLGLCCFGDSILAADRRIFPARKTRDRACFETTPRTYTSSARQTSTSTPSFAGRRGVGFPCRLSVPVPAHREVVSSRRELACEVRGSGKADQKTLVDLGFCGSFGLWNRSFIVLHLGSIWARLKGR